MDSQKMGQIVEVKRTAVGLPQGQVLFERRRGVFAGELPCPPHLEWVDVGLLAVEFGSLSPGQGVGLLAEFVEATDSVEDALDPMLLGEGVRGRWAFGHGGVQVGF
jgi:hypothetical protein